MLLAGGAVNRPMSLKFCQVGAFGAQASTCVSMELVHGDTFKAASRTTDKLHSYVGNAAKDVGNATTQTKAGI